MLPTQHLILGIIFSSILFFLFPQIGLIGFLIIIFSSVLIDVDHYLYYVYKKKDLSLKESYNWFIKRVKKFRKLPRKQRNNIYLAFCFLHGIEILIILLLFSKIFPYFLFIFAGFAFHLLLDIVYETTYFDRIDKFSLVHDFLKFKKIRIY